VEEEGCWAPETETAVRAAGYVNADTVGTVSK